MDRFELSYRIRSIRTAVLEWINRHIERILVVCSLMGFIFPRILAKYNHMPPVGVYVAIMGFVIALMAIRKDPSGWEKGLWVVLITALMVAEVQNLYRADHEQALLFSQITQDLKDTKSGLDIAAAGIKSETGTLQVSLEATNQLLLQTKPFAQMSIGDIFDDHNQPLDFSKLSANSQFAYDLFFRDIGTGPASGLRRFSDMFIGKEGDRESEEGIRKEFDLKWRKSQTHQIVVTSLPVSSKDAYNLFLAGPFSQEQVDGVLKLHTLTVYVLARFSYKDATGMWIADFCEIFNEPWIRDGVAHSCKFNTDPRHQN